MICVNFFAPFLGFVWISVHICASAVELGWGRLSLLSLISRASAPNVRMCRWEIGQRGNADMCFQMRYHGLWGRLRLKWDIILRTNVFKWDITVHEDVSAAAPTSNETLSGDICFQMRYKPLWGCPHLNVNLKWDIMRTFAPCSCLWGHMCTKFSNEILQLI